MLEPGATRAGSVAEPGDPLTFGLSPASPVGRSMKPGGAGAGLQLRRRELLVTSGSFGPVGSVLTLWPLMFSPAASARSAVGAVEAVGPRCRGPGRAEGRLVGRGGEGRAVAGGRARC